MSTLVTTNLKHGGAAGNNIVLNSDGSTTVSGALTLGTSPLAVPSGSAPSYTCRAWVNFNGTGTVAIRESGNVSSITDNGTGSYTVNFTTAMPDENYAFSGGARSNSDSGGTSGITASPSLSHIKTTSSIQFSTKRDTALIDSTEVNIAIFR